MLHPVGDLAPSVYWRRRILLLAALVLVGLSVVAVLRSGGGPNNAASAPGSSSHASTSHASSAPVTSRSSSQPSTSTASTSPARTTPVTPVACPATQLNIASATDAASYPVGSRPNLAIVVTNKGPAPCVTDLADPQIELRVFSGSARVWGSHDCQVQPGTSIEMLPVGQPIRRVIQWSGLSSQPGCAGVRQRVPAGTYTLYPLLAGHQGSTTTFAFTS